MDFKKIKKTFSRFLGWIGLNISSLIVKVIPPKSLYGFARVVSFLAYIFAGRQRQIAFDSLRIAFGKEKDEGN